MNTNKLASDFLKKHGFKFCKSEYYDFFSKRRKDLFGIFDFVGVKSKLYGIQVSSINGYYQRRKKIDASDITEKWLSAGGEIIILTFQKKGGRIFPRVFRRTSKWEEVKIENIDPF